MSRAGNREIKIHVVKVIHFWLHWVTYIFQAQYLLAYNFHIRATLQTAAKRWTYTDPTGTLCYLLLLWHICVSVNLFVNIYKESSLFKNVGCHKIFNMVWDSHTTLNFGTLWSQSVYSWLGFVVQDEVSLGQEGPKPYTELLSCSVQFHNAVCSSETMMDWHLRRIHSNTYQQSSWDSNGLQAGCLGV
jgi:hypothetical protein